MRVYNCKNLNIKIINIIFDFSLIISKQVKLILIYNKACKIIQCFKCYYYEHIII